MNMIGHNFAPEKLPLFGYQAHAADIMAGRDRYGLHDEMGIGKTATSIGAVNRILGERGVVICPAMLRENWMREFRKFSTYDLRLCKGQTIHDFVAWSRGRFDVLVTSYELAAKWRNGNLIPIVINMDAFGIANGGMATTVVNDPEGPWPWTDTIGVGEGGSYDPEYAEEFTVLYIAGAIQSASSFLMCSYYWPAPDRMVNYITDGDLVGLLNSAFPGNFVLGSYVLGRPPISQKYEVSR